MLSTHFKVFAHYNRWANQRLYTAAGELTREQFHEDAGAYFKSLCGTLNHLLATDMIWGQRVSGGGAAPASLDAILHRELAPLRAARELMDERIVVIVERLDEAGLSAAIRYRRVSTPEEIVQPLTPALAHWFNHQTHHRGQAHAILTRLAGRAPELDLLIYQRLHGTPV